MFGQGKCLNKSTPVIFSVINIEHYFSTHDVPWMIEALRAWLLMFWFRFEYTFYTDYLDLAAKIWWEYLEKCSLILPSTFISQTYKAKSYEKVSQIGFLFDWKLSEIEKIKKNDPTDNFRLIRNVLPNTSNLQLISSSSESGAKTFCAP